MKASSPTRGGRLDDPADGHRDHATTRVKISSCGTYRYDATAERGADAPVFTVFTVRPVRNDVA